MPKYEFAIKKDILNSGKIILTPVCRKVTVALIDKILGYDSWERITKVYNDYILLDLSSLPDLTLEECEEHIRAYQQKLLKQKENEVAEVEYHTLEEKDL